MLNTKFKKKTFFKNFKLHRNKKQQHTIIWKLSNIVKQCVHDEKQDHLEVFLLHESITSTNNLTIFALYQTFLGSVAPNPSILRLIGLTSIGIGCCNRSWIVECHFATLGSWTSNHSLNRSSVLITDTHQYEYIYDYLFKPSGDGTCGIGYL